MLKQRRKLKRKQRKKLKQRYNTFVVVVVFFEKTYLSSQAKKEKEEAEAKAKKEAEAKVIEMVFIQFLLIH
jgi:tRNA A37 threonylcarbamoyladenosine dehydratase